MQMFMKPTGFATKVVGRGSSMAFGVLKKVVGIDLLADLGEFFQAFSGMVDGFPRARQAGQRAARRPGDLLHDRLRPQGEPIEEAVFFHRKLVEAKLPVGGVIVNKVHYESEADLSRRGRRGPRQPPGRPRRARRLQLRRLPGARPGAMPPTSSTCARAQRQAGDPGPLHGRGRPRPRRPAQDQPLPVRATARKWPLPELA